MTNGIDPKGRFSRTGIVGKGLAGKKPGAPISKAEARMMKRARLLPAKNIAKSAAHEGVVERPMDKGISKLLEIRRAQAKGKGTSVYRLKKTKEEEEEELRAEQRASSVFRLNRGEEDEEAQTTSVGRLRADRLQLAQLPPDALRKKPKKTTYGDLDI